jgi:hypothetical protein
MQKYTKISAFKLPVEKIVEKIWKIVEENGKLYIPL